jgi:hypothetical protein
MNRTGVETNIGSFTYNAAVDENGYLWTANLFDGTFSKIDSLTGSIIIPSKKVTVQEQFYGINYTKTLRPWDVYIDGNDVYFSISDDFTGINNYNYLAMRVDSNGNLDKLYGTKQMTGKLNLGRSLTVDKDGYLWVANPSTVVDWFKPSTVDKFNTETAELVPGCSVATNLTEYRNVVPYAAFTAEDGFIWAVNGLGHNANSIGNAVEINPSTCQLTGKNVTVGNYPIPYSYHLFD